MSFKELPYSIQLKFDFRLHENLYLGIKMYRLEFIKQKLSIRVLIGILKLLIINLEKKSNYNNLL